MCGINGIFGLEQIERPKDVVEKMNRALAHRGPDATGIYVHDKIVLGHQRLSIIDLDEKANQPMHSIDKRYWMVYNGEVYNFKKIRAEIPDYPFKTKSDTEVVLAAYMKWGVDAFQKFNGMFALAIWDAFKEELIIARDRVGIKPLYYCNVGNSIVFSSEVRSLLSSELIDRRLDLNGLVDYLRYATVHAPYTILQNVNILEPGHFAKFSDVEFEKGTYHEFEPNPKAVSGDYNAVQKNIRTKLLESVERRLISDVPHGAFLSGGIDSTAIVGLMSELSDQRVKTFSVVFDEAQFDESAYSRMVAKKFNTDHCEIKLSVNDFKAILPEALNAMDHPSGDGPNSYLVSKRTRENGITVALSGLGGDELFAGYDLFTYCASLSNKKWVTSFPKFVRQMAGGVYAGIKRNVSGNKIEDILAKDYFDLEYIYPTMRTVLFDDQILKLLHREKLPLNRVFEIGEERIGLKSKAIRYPYLSKVSLMEMATYMSNTLLRDTDQMSMASALEVRVPFLDHQLIEFVLDISDGHKYPVTPKKLLTDALKDIIPGEVINRPKMGFTFPWQKWMTGDLREFCTHQLNGLKERTPFNAGELDRIWNRFLANDPTMTWSRLWPLIVLEYWMTKHNIEA